MTFAVSINPLYTCNFRCPFCYLTDNQLKNKTQLKLKELRLKLTEISLHKVITHIELYGGEVSLLDESYVLAMIELIRDFYAGSISVITNLSQIPNWFYRDDIDVAVSWDYIEREQNYNVLNNMIQFDKPFHVLMLASEGMINWSDEILQEAITLCDNMPKLTSVEIKPYSSNQANQQNVSFKDYENFIKRWMEASPLSSRQYELVNENNIKKVFDGKGHSLSDDHIYITPKGELAVLSFDRYDREFFSPMRDMYEYFTWTLNEMLMINSSRYCSTCDFKGRCLSEHLREVENLEQNSCSGFIGLLEWYQNTY